VTVIGLAARFETPVDVTVVELRIELLFPARPALGGLLPRDMT
jgi:hypothetical protein